ncbi:hypothetical protein CEV32_4327 [Brucella rhizosphaerae]|uniref:Insertion element IS402-like domain-containing protein n=1 Tax=Brucella rhizosphaerae TaxID=571254 RepID=A0A256FPC2_9HYPH|nr:hypothetical protein CEV32_4327 [Brucella rhizosphaerae]
MGKQIVFSDEEWFIIGMLLPPEHGRSCRPAQDNRLYFEGMMWIARTGWQWRHLPDEYGKWNSVFRRYRRWATTGMFDAMPPVKSCRKLQLRPSSRLGAIAEIPLSMTAKHNDCEISLSAIP